MPNIYFDLNDFRSFVERFPNYGEPYNAPIYFLFRKDPQHADLETTNAKLLFIDRIYNANIGNYVGKWRGDEQNGGAIPWLGQQLHCDPIFRDLMSNALMADSFGAETIPNIVSHVRSFAALINSKLKDRDGDGLVSACSKYLHFHSPAHPIFDRDSTSALHLICHDPEWRIRLRDRPIKKHPWVGRLSYDEQCSKVLQLLKRAFPDADSFGKEIKQLDHYLIALYRKEWLKD